MSSLIPELERELQAMVAGQASGRAPAPVSAARPGRRRRLSRRGALILAAVLLLAATAALAATGTIPLGAPVHDPPGVITPKADADNGTVVPGTARVLSLRVADPDGGPPWGLRLTATTRGLDCLNVGRVVGGRLGALGRDGLFADDGRFHPLPVDVQSTIGTCALLDGDGHFFAAGGYGAMPAAGLAQGACYLRGTVVGDPTRRACPDADERTLFVGALGPRARSITYVGDDGREHTAPTAPPYGAYLIVRRQDPASGHGSGVSMAMYGVPDPNPTGTPITKVTFAGGQTCAVTRDGWAAGPQGCPALGFRPRPAPHVHTADVRSPVHARLEHRDGQRVMVVRWRVRVAITDATTAYWVTRRRRGSRGWGSGPTRRNLRRGETAEQVWYSPIPGTYTGRVTYTWLGGAGPQSRRQLVVGAYTLKVPPRRHTG